MSHEHRSHHGCHSQVSVSQVSAGVTSPCKAMLSTAVEGKQELSSLTDQLASLMTRMRGARQSAHTFDASSYQETICSMECELSKVKDLYECELARLRCQLEEATSSRAASSSMYDSCRMEIHDLKTKLGSHSGSYEKLQNELCCTRSELVRAKQTIAELQNCLLMAKQESQNVTVCNKFEIEYEDCKRSLECERRCRLEAEEMIKTLKDKLAFESRMREQVRSELEQRLQTQCQMVKSLELQVSEQDSHKLDYSDILAKLREGTSAELHRYKSESEMAMNKNLEGLRLQFESEKSVRCGLTVEKERMEYTITDLRSRLAECEGQMTGVLKQRDALEELLRTERSRACCQIRDLETKLGELNTVMLDKVKECTNAREAQVSLKTEIDAFRVLLKEGETRLNTGSSSDWVSKEKLEFSSSSGYKTLDASIGNIGVCDWTYNKCKPVETTTDIFIAARPPTTDVYMTPRAPITPRRLTRPTSAHASCHRSTTRIAPVDDPIFHAHKNTEYRSSAGTGSCLRRSRCYDTDDIDVRRSSGKRVTMEFQPGTVRKISVKDDIEVCGKGISSCYSTPFPKRCQNWGEHFTTKKGARIPRSSRPHTAYGTTRASASQTGLSLGAQPPNAYCDNKCITRNKCFNKTSVHHVY